MTTVEQGTSFEKQVEILLRLAGYRVRRDVEVAGTQIDLLAERNEGFLLVSYVVECADRSRAIGIEEVKTKAGFLTAAIGTDRVYCLLFVSRGGFTRPAREFARHQPRLQLLTERELEARIIDFQPYVDWYCHNFSTSEGPFAEDRLHDFYVDPDAEEEDDSHRAPITRVALDWLGRAEETVLFVLGEFGSGKTSFLRHLTFQLLSKHGTDGGAVIPILINLRGYRTGINLQQVITDTLVNEYGVALPSFQAFQRYCSTGRLLLLFDGFDEMADKADETTVIDCMSQIFILSELNARQIVTCRSNYFHSNAQLFEALRTSQIELTDSDSQVPTRGRRGKVITVCPFTPEKVREFVRKHSPDEASAKAILRDINAIHDLSDLCTRPVLLDMVLDTLPSLTESGSVTNSAALYDRYTDRWSTRDEWRVATPLQVRRDLCEAIAWGMLARKIDELNYSELRALLRNVLAGIDYSDHEFERFSNDIQTCSFLVRAGNADGFSFAHRSFMEYFVGRRMSAGLASGRPLADIIAGVPSTQVVDTLARWDDITPQTLHVSLGDYFTLHNWIFVADERLNRGGLRVKGSASAAMWREGSPLRGAIGERAVAVFRQTESDAGRLPFTLSQEIATFALEELEHRKVPLERVMDSITDGDARSLWCEIIRTAGGEGFFRANSKSAFKVVFGKGDLALRAAVAAALARCGEFRSVKALEDLRVRVPHEVFDYTLYCLATRTSGSAAGLLDEYRKSVDLSDLQRLTALVGARDRLGDAQYLTEVAEVLPGLAVTASADNGLVSALLDEVQPAEDVVLEVSESIYGKRGASKVKGALAEILGRSELQSTVDGIKRLRIREPDPSVRRQLQRAEDRVRSRVAQRRGGRSRKKEGRLVEDRLWSALRAK